LPEGYPALRAPHPPSVTREEAIATKRLLFVRRNLQRNALILLALFIHNIPTPGRFHGICC
jgi:hypothetical protein